MGIQFSGLASGLDTDSIIKDLMSIERMSVEKVEKEKTKLEWKKDIWEDMNSEIYSFYTKEVFELKSSGTFQSKDASASQPNAIDVSASVNATRGIHTIEVTNLAKGSFITGTQLAADFVLSKTAEDLDGTLGATFDIKFSVDVPASYTTITVDKTDTIADILSDIQDAVGDDMNISYDDNFKRFFISSKESGETKQISLDGDGDGLKLLTQLGFDGANRTGSLGENSAFTYNGTDFETTSNEVTINGLELTLLEETGGAATITVIQDTDAIYDKVKNFILKYNELLLDINGKINADSARNYEPLTDEEKEAMTEDDIKLWENKIKDSLLRRDTTLTSLLNSMKSVVVSSSGVDTTGFDYNYLSDLGIVTGSYTEKGILHIEGDEDDPTYSYNTNKLREAIEDDPEKVAELLTAIGEELYSTMQDKMQSTSLSSALTFYNDKQMDSKVSEYEDRISELESRLVAIEERYYKQFTAMEVAIQNMNSQSSYITSMLG